MAPAPPVTSFEDLLTLRKPSPATVRVVELTGLLLKLGLGPGGAGPGCGQPAPFPQEIVAAVQCGASPLYAATVQALVQDGGRRVLRELASLPLESVCNELALKVYSATLAPPFCRTPEELQREQQEQQEQREQQQDYSSPSSNTIQSGGSGGGNGYRRRLSSRTNTTDHRCAAFGPSSSAALGSGPATEVGFFASAASQQQATGGSRGAGRGGQRGRGGGHGASSGVVGAPLIRLRDAVLAVVERLKESPIHLPLVQRTVAVAVDGSRMSYMALEVAASMRRDAGPFVVLHAFPEGGSAERQALPDHVQPDFLEAEITEKCVKQLGVPPSRLRVVLLAVPASSTVAEVLDSACRSLRVDHLFVGCYGRGGHKASRYGEVAKWALEVLYAQTIIATPHSHSQIREGPEHNPCVGRRYLAAVKDLSGAKCMVQHLLEIMSPRDTLQILNVVNETEAALMAGDTVDIVRRRAELQQLVRGRGIQAEVRVEKLSQRPVGVIAEHIINAVQGPAPGTAGTAAVGGTGASCGASGPAAGGVGMCVGGAGPFDVLAIKVDETRTCYRTVADRVVREAGCFVLAVHDTHPQSEQGG